LDIVAALLIVCATEMMTVTYRAHQPTICYPWGTCNAKSCELIIASVRTIAVRATEADLYRKGKCLERALSRRICLNLIFVNSNRGGGPCIRGDLYAGTCSAKGRHQCLLCVTRPVSPPLHLPSPHSIQRVNRSLNK
jgi:hypothetical protein